MKSTLATCSGSGRPRASSVGSFRSALMIHTRPWNVLAGCTDATGLRVTRVMRASRALVVSYNRALIEPRHQRGVVVGDKVAARVAQRLAPENLVGPADQALWPGAAGALDRRWILRNQFAAAEIITQDQTLEGRWERDKARHATTRALTRVARHREVAQGRNMCWLVLSLLTLLSCVASAPMQLRLVKDPAARCNDGSPGAYYYRAGSDDRVIVHLQVQHR
jgi:hypothetical protein